MDIERSCRECGAPVGRPSRTRPVELCGECKRGRRRRKTRESYTCADCAGVFMPVNHTGKTPSRCPDCQATRRRQAGAERSKAWRDAHPDRAREASTRSNRKRLADPEYREAKRDREVLRKYGLTRAALDLLIEQQDRRCAICRSTHVGPGTRLHVDHDHLTGTVRGLLCSPCNTAIGLLRDDPQLAEAAAAYLRRR